MEARKVIEVLLKKKGNLTTADTKKLKKLVQLVKKIAGNDRN